MEMTVWAGIGTNLLAMLVVLGGVSYWYGILNHTVSSMRSDIEAFKKDVQKINERLEPYATSQARFEEVIKNLTETVSELRETVAENINRRLNIMEQDIREIRARCDEVRRFSVCKTTAKDSPAPPRDHEIAPF